MPMMAYASCHQLVTDCTFNFSLRHVECLSAPIILYDATTMKPGKVAQSGRSVDYRFSPNTDAAVLTASSAAGKPAYTAICRIISKI